MCVCVMPIHLCVRAHACVCLHACTHIRVPVSVHTHVHIHVSAHTQRLCAHVHAHPWGCAAIEEAAAQPAHPLLAAAPFRAVRGGPWQRSPRELAGQMGRGVLLGAPPGLPAPLLAGRWLHLPAGAGGTSRNANYRPGLQPFGAGTGRLARRLQPHRRHLLPFPPPAPGPRSQPTVPRCPTRAAPSAVTPPGGPKPGAPPPPPSPRQPPPPQRFQPRDWGGGGRAGRPWANRGRGSRGTGCPRWDARVPRGVPVPPGRAAGAPPLPAPVAMGTAREAPR